MSSMMRILRSGTNANAAMFQLWFRQHRPNKNLVQWEDPIQKTRKSRIPVLVGCREWPFPKGTQASMMAQEETR